MVQIIFFLLLFVGTANAALFVATPECPYTGHSTCSDGIDNDADGVVDEAAPSGAFQADGVNYRAKLSACQSVTFATTSDATFPSGDYVSKAPTVEWWRGEIMCAGTITAGTYEILLNYALPTGPSFVWFKVGSTHGIHLDNANNATILAQQNTPAWANNTSKLTKTGSLANAFARTNSATALTATFAGGAAVLAMKAEGGVRSACIYLRLEGDTTAPSCPDESGSGTPGHYAIYKLSGSAPTSCADAQFNNANVWNWIGSSSTADGPPNFKLLWDANRGYLCTTITDNDLRAVVASHDVFPSNDDHLEISWRDSTATTARDSTTFKLTINPLNFRYTANYPSGVADTGQSLSESCSVTLSGDIDLTSDDASYQIFCSFLWGFTATNGMQIRAEIHVVDAEAAGLSSRTGCGSTINNPANWCLIDFLATTVPGGGGDTTAPTVTDPAVPDGNIQELSAVMTASTNEAGTCRVHYGTLTGSYPFFTAGSASVNGLCTEALGTGGAASLTDPPLTADMEYFAVMRVTDAANNTGSSSEVSFTTDEPAPPICNYYAGPTRAGAQDGSSDANRFLIGDFWAVASDASGGKSLCLRDGTYTGASSMITPPASKKGTALAPIKITGTNDGGAIIDGQNARPTLYLASDNDWFILERFDVRNSNNDLVEIGPNSDNNIVRRVVGYDASQTLNISCFSIHGGTNNLFEDVAAFGFCRKLFTFSQSGQSNSTIRRAWGSWTGSTRSDPKMVFSIAYNSYGNKLENVIGTWKEEGSNNTSARHGIIGNDQMFNTNPSADKCSNSAVYGSIAYHRSVDTLASNYFGQLQSSSTVDCITYDNIVAYEESATARNITLNNLSVTHGGPSTNYILRRSTSIGGNTNNIGGDWTQTSNEDVATVGAASNIWTGAGSTGARVCFRYVDGVLSSTKLWPWPMDDRINAALTASGRNPDNYFGTGNTLTDLMESIFGTIPAACKS